MPSESDQESLRHVRTCGRRVDAACAPVRKMQCHAKGACALSVQGLRAR